MSTIASHSPLNILETVIDKACLVPKDHQYEMAYGESNGHVTNDVTWLRKVKLMTPMRLEPISRKQLLFSNNRKLLDSLLWGGSTVGYPIDSLAFWLFVNWTQPNFEHHISLSDKSWR